MNKNEMMDDVARKFGMENEYTIDFCSMVESGRYRDGVVLCYYIVLMAMDTFCEEQPSKKKNKKLKIGLDKHQALCYNKDTKGKGVKRK